MTLDDFMSVERARLEAFRAAWTKANSTHPNMFPLSAEKGNEGMWDEALATYSGENFDLTDLVDIEKETG